MRQTSVRVRHLSNNLLAVFQSKEQSLVEQPIGVFFDFDTSRGADRFRRDARQLVRVQSHMALGHLLSFIAYEAPSGEAKEVLVCVPIRNRVTTLRACVEGLPAPVVICPDTLTAITRRTDVRANEWPKISQHGFRLFI